MVEWVNACRANLLKSNVGRPVCYTLISIDMTPDIFHNQTLTKTFTAKSTRLAQILRRDGLFLLPNFKKWGVD